VTDKTHNSTGIDTLVGAEMHIEGDITCTGALHVQGAIHGNVLSDGGANASVTIDRTGSVNGMIQAVHILVRGHVVGPINSSQTIEIYPEGTITGEISFKALAIHAGGIVEGFLNPLQATSHSALGNIPLPPPPPPTDGFQQHVTHPFSRVSNYWGHVPRVTLVAVAIAVVATTWGLLAPSSEEEQTPPPRIDSTQSSTLEQKQITPSLTESNSAPLSKNEHTSSAGEVSDKSNTARPSPIPEPLAHAQEKVLVVKGANPNRPPGVFLLVSSETCILYRKKRDDPGEGARITVAQGERVSVSIARDELIRIASGYNITIFYQGQKVPQNIIESSAWISFAPKSL
jgi:cytoskeletal protein CcmA (bactofilin family)